MLDWKDERSRWCYFGPGVGGVTMWRLELWQIYAVVADMKKYG